jgi:excisionase family DNA binding protein
MSLPVKDLSAFSEDTPRGVRRPTSISASPYRPLAMMAGPAGLGLLQQLDARRSALKILELAELLQISNKEIYKLASDGDIPHYRIRTGIRFCPAETAAWLRSCRCGEGG